MGTKITNKSLGHDPKEDYRWVTKALKKDEKIINTNSKKELKELLKDPDIFFLKLGRKDIYAVNKLKCKRQTFLLLEGNPVTYYYSLAFDVSPQITEAKTLLIDSLKKMNSKYKWDTAVAFSYVFKVSASAIIFSFLAIEAFLNQCLPDYAKVQFDKKMVDKNTIQRYLTFEDKLKIIIPNITKKDFYNDHPKKMELLMTIKKYRDDLIHLKEIRRDGMVAYEDIYNNILKVDIKKIINVVKFYINYHKPKTIINYKEVKKQRAQILGKELGEDDKGRFVKYYY